MSLNCYKLNKDYDALVLRNRKHVLRFCRVIETLVEVWENEKCLRNTIQQAGLN